VGVSVGQAADRLGELVAAGLAVASEATPGSYAAAAPHDVLLPALLAREMQLAQARHRLVRLASRHASRTANGPAYTGVRVADGGAETLKLYQTLLESAEETIAGVDAPPYVGDPLEGDPAIFAALRRGVRIRTLYDRQALDVPVRLADLEEGVRAGEEARVGDAPAKFAIADERTALLLSYRDDGTPYAMLISEPALVAGVVALFEACWDAATPLRITGHDSSLDGRPDDTDKRLLAMLAAGYTDAEIGASLGWSDRRVRRHIATVYERLDATSRFQAGYQAYVRGWLSA
jgi:sugar-specific transcriptional regulator TrmB